MSEVATPAVPTSTPAEAPTPGTGEDGKIIDKLPKIEQVKARINELIMIRDAKIASAETEAANAIDQIKVKHKQDQEAEVKVVKEELKAAKASFRNGCKMAVSRWNGVLKALEVEPVEISEEVSTEVPTVPSAVPEPIKSGQ